MILNYEEYEKNLNIVEGLDIRYLKWSKMWDVIAMYQLSGKRHNLLNGIFFVNIFIMPLYMALQISSFFYEEYDLDELTFHLLNPITAVQIILKITVFWYNISNQTALINLFSSNFLDHIPEEDKIASNAILRKFIKKSNRLCMMAVMSNTATVVFWDFLPMARSELVLNGIFGMNITSNGKENKVLAGWYPFDYGKSPAYELVYVYEFLCCTSAGVVFTLHELLVVQLVMMLCAHMAILGNSLENLKVKSISTFHKDSEESKILEKKINNLTKDHGKILDAGENLKNSYIWVISLQLLTGMPIMIMSAFHFASGVSDTLFLIKFLVYCSYALVEIIIYCVGGNEMEVVLILSSVVDVKTAIYSCQVTNPGFLQNEKGIIESESIAESVYGSDWFLLSKKFRINVQLIMLRSQTPIMLKAGKLYPVNLVTLDSILQFTYSTTMFLAQLV